MNKRLLFILIGALNLWQVRGEEQWETIPRLTTQFLLQNEHLVISDSDLENTVPDEIVGLKLTDQTGGNWSRFAEQLTNLVYLRVTTTNISLEFKLFSTLEKFRNLKYLHLEARNAVEIPQAISVLSNSPSLEYLALDCPSAKTISANIYSIAGLKGLLIRAGNINLPSGISQLTNLQRLEIYGGQNRSFRSFPEDISKSQIRRLEVSNVTNVQQILTSLPPTLLELRIGKCRLESIPKKWLFHQQIEVLDLNGNEITSFPTEIFKLPSIRLVGLDLNRITNIPPVVVPINRSIKITVMGNPIKNIAEENLGLIERGVIIAK